MNHLLRSIIIASFMYSCGQGKVVKDNKLVTPSIVNTRWECKIVEGCINYYEFRPDSNFLFYSCETEDSLYGDFYFKGDTLILDEKGSVYDKNYPEDSIHKIGRKMYWISINGNNLIHLKMSEWVDGKFEKSSFKFDAKYLYIKVE